MKKIIIISLFLFGAMMNFTHAEAKTKTCQIGAFRYKYKVEGQGVWITNITPLSSKGIATLNIPSKLSGKKVRKLGASGDAVKDYDDFDRDTNLFGVGQNEDYPGLLPKNIHKKVEKIKVIKIPSTVKILTRNCFSHIQDGKNINIPAGVTENVIIQFTCVKWKRIDISVQNKKFKVKKGCLLSKNGKILYGFVQKKKKIVIPSTVKEIVDRGADYNGCSTIVIPKSVNKIEKSACSTDKPVTVKVAKGNKRYAVKYGSVYSKVSGRLALGYVNNGVLKIPEEVTIIDEHGFLGGDEIKKIIFPAGVKKIRNLHNLKPILEGEFICVFYGKNPPELIEPFPWGNPTIYVPKNCKGKYMDQWKQLLEKPFCKITFIEMK